MTAQISEELFLEGETHQMFTTPLDEYCALGWALPKFAPSPTTSLGRGYVGTWEVIDDRLYLIAINGKLKTGQAASLEAVFPGCGERIFSHWYSGTIRVPQGKILEYVHAGFCSTYERDLLLEFEKGVLKTRTIKTNTVPVEIN